MVRELALLYAGGRSRDSTVLRARPHVAQLMSLDSRQPRGRDHHQSRIRCRLHAYNLHLRCLQAAASASAAAETILILMALKKLSASEDASEPVTVRRCYSAPSPLLTHLVHVGHGAACTWGSKCSASRACKMGKGCGRGEKRTRGSIRQASRTAKCGGAEGAHHHTLEVAMRQLRARPRGQSGTKRLQSVYRSVPFSSRMFRVRTEATCRGSGLTPYISTS